MAEVLITLGIIGVVAALTLPTMISHHKNQVYVNKLKKIVSTIENGLRQASADEGVAINQTELFTELIAAYCFDDGCLNKYNIIKKYFKVVSKDDVSYKKFCLSRPLYSCPITVDGTINFMDGSAMSYKFGPKLGIDTNGAQKPNEFGRDYFWLLIDENGILHDYDDCDLEFLSDYRSYRVTSCGKCENNSNPNECFFYHIQKDGWKMNY